jgi:flagellar biosynthesis protein FliR
MFIGIAVKNLVGMTVLLAAVAYWPRVFNQQFSQAIQTAERLLRLAH